MIYVLQGCFTVDIPPRIMNKQNQLLPASSPILEKKILNDLSLSYLSIDKDTLIEELRNYNFDIGRNIMYMNYIIRNLIGPDSFAILEEAVGIGTRNFSMRYCKTSDYKYIQLGQHNNILRPSEFLIIDTELLLPIESYGALDLTHTYNQQRIKEIFTIISNNITNLNRMFEEIKNLEVIPPISKVQILKL